MATAGVPNPNPTSGASAPASRAVWTVPNLISFARLLLVPGFVWAFLTERNWLGVALLVTIGSTDWVDGYVARRFNQVSELGKLLDPVADRIAIVAVLVVFLVTGVLPAPLAAVILLRDLIVAVAFPILEKRGMERIPVNRTGKWATASIFFGLAGLAIGLAAPEPYAAGFHAAALALLVIGAVLYWAATYLYVGEVRRRLAVLPGQGR
ncbi:MAG: CDP-alcohol phosphatidyltransferase family protein [Actinomycetota bacterium]